MKGAKAGCSGLRSSPCLPGRAGQRAGHRRSRGRGQVGKGTSSAAPAQEQGAGVEVEVERWGQGQGQEVKAGDRLNTFLTSLLSPSLASP